MPDVKIGVGADGKDVAKAVEQITDAVNDLAKAVGSASKVEFKPGDVSKAVKDIELLNKQFDIAIKRSKALRDGLKATGQEGKQLHQIDFNKLAVNPAQAATLRNRVFNYSAQGTAWQVGAPNVPAVAPGGTPAQPSSPTPSPRQPSPAPAQRTGIGFAGRAVNSFASGVGGGVGQIANSAVSGATAEAGGGMAGLMRGGLIGAALFGLFKGGQAISEGYGMAKERDTTLDTLKRQMGDLGVSFSGLKAMTDVASQGLGVNSKEFAQLSEQYNRASHNADKTIESLGGNVQSAVQFARAYGMEPGQSASFFGSMRNVDPKQNNRELAVQIADAVQRSGGRAMAGDVMGIIQSLATSVSRMSLSTPNTDAYAAAFGNMLHSGSPGMTAENVASMLGTANNAISGMGAAGEAGQNFILGSLGQNGGGNPIAIRALAASGMFGTRSSVFGSGTELNKYLGANGVDSTSLIGKNGGVTNWESIRGNLMKSYNDPWLRLDGAQRLLGLSSPEQAAAMMNLSGKQSGGLSRALATAGVKLSDLNPGGIQTMANIGGATSMSDLNSIYADIKGRHGPGSLSRDERDRLDQAQKGDMEDFRKALLDVMKGKDQASTDAKEMIKGIKDLETAQTEVGDKLIAPMNVMRDALLKLAGVDGKSATAASLHKAAYDAERSDVNEGYDAQAAAVRKNAFEKSEAIKKIRYAQSADRHHSNPVALDAQEANLKRQTEQDLADIEKKRQADLKDVDDRYRSPAPNTAAKDDSGNDGAADRFNTSGAASSVAANSDIKKLMAMGWTAHQAAGIVANLHAESGGNEKAIGDSGLAYGMAQWHPSRQADFARFAGHDIRSSTHDEQLAFVNDELRKGKYKGVGAKLAALSDAGDAGALISKEYESPRDAEGEAAKRRKMASSLAVATDTLNVNINLNALTKDGKGGTISHNMQTSVAVPRGSGTQSVEVAH